MPKIGELLKRSRTKAAFAKAVGEVQTELDRHRESLEVKAGRRIEVQSIPVVDYKPSASEHVHHLAQRGTLTLFVSRKGDGWIERVRSAASAGGGKDAELAREIRQRFLNREILPRKQAQELFRSQPVLADLRYGQKPLVSDLFPPPDGGPAVLVLEYNGGPISTDSFSIMEYLQEGVQDRLEGVIVRHTPELTAAEQVALRDIPGTMSDLHIGVSTVAIGTCIWYASAVAAAAVVWMTATADCAGMTLDPRIDDDRIRKIGPLATARELVNARRQILAGRGL